MRRAPQCRPTCCPYARAGSVGKKTSQGVSEARARHHVVKGTAHRYIAKLGHRDTGPILNTSFSKLYRDKDEGITHN